MLTKKEEEAWEVRKLVSVASLITLLGRLLKGPSFHCLFCVNIGSQHIFMNKNWGMGGKGFYAGEDSWKCTTSLANGVVITVQIVTKTEFGFWKSYWLCSLNVLKPSSHFRYNEVPRRGNVGPQKQARLQVAGAKTTCASLHYALR